MGGDPDLNPLPDADVVNKIGAKTGLNVDGIGPGHMQSDLYIGKTDYIASSLRSGRSVHMTVPGNGTVAHSVSVKGTFIKNVTKVNGSLKYSLAHRIFDPARSSPYYVSSRWVNDNAINIFSMWR